MNDKNKQDECANDMRIGKLRTLTNGTSRETYNGAELGKTSHRPGAYDFQDCQSIINGELRHYRGSM